MSCGPMIAGGSCGASHSRHAGAPARGQGRSGRAGPGCSRGGGGPSGAAAGGWGGRGLAGRSLGRCRAGPARLPGLRAVRGRAREPPGARRGSGHGSGGSAGRRVPGAWCRHGWSGRDRAGPARVGSDSCRAGCGASGDRRRTAGRSAVRRRAVRGHWPHRRERSAPGARPARRRRGARGGASRPLMPLDFLIARFDELPATRALATGLPGPGARVPVSGLPGSSPALLIAALARRFPQRVFVVITSTPTDAERWLADARALAGDAAAALYPQREALGAEEPHVEIAGERIETLEALLSGKVNILVTTARATAERTAVPAALAAMRLVLEAGLGARGPGSGGLTDVVNRLSVMGYTRVPTVTEVAQFSVRGGILDVYGFGMAAPTRVEWSGDEIVSLRPFDLDSQRSGGGGEQIGRVSILPVRSEEPISAVGAQGAAPLQRQSLLDLIPTDALLVLAQESALEQEVDRAWAEAEHHLEIARRLGEAPPARAEIFVAPEQWRRELGTFARVALDAPGEATRFPLTPPEPVDRDIKRLRRLVVAGPPTGILCDNAGPLARVEGPLGAEGATLAGGALGGGFGRPSRRGR